MKYMVWIMVFFMAITSCGKEKPSSDRDTSVDQPTGPWIGRVTASSLFIRTLPSAKATVMDTILKSHRIEVLSDASKKETLNGITAAWLKVKLPSGKIGYAFGGYIEQPQSEEYPPASKHAVMRCPDTMKSSFECARFIEKKIWPKIETKVKRTENVLHITCDNGKTVRFTDNATNDIRVVFYSVVRYYKSVKLLLVLHNYYEGIGYSVVNERNGAYAVVWDQPLFSPDGKRFIASSIDLVAGYNPNGIQIWHVGDNAFIKEFERKLTWGPLNPMWENDTQISMLRIEGMPGRYLSFKAELTHHGRNWVLYE